MSKFFTRLMALLLASVGAALASDSMNPSAPSLAKSENSGAPDSPGADLPVLLNAGRFAALGKKSPFTLASTTEENADFAKDLFLAGYFRMDGKDFILVGNRTQPTRLMVGTEPSPAAQGLTLAKVEKDPAGDLTKIRAQIRKGAETAILKYESASAQKELAVQPVPMPPQGLGQPPGVQPGSVVPGGAVPKAITNAPLLRQRKMPVPLPPSR